MYLPFRITLIVLLLVSTNSLLIMQAMFSWRATALVERLCENRNRPELNCNGKCVLTKMAWKVQQEEESRQAVGVQFWLTVNMLASACIEFPLREDRPLVWAEWKDKTLSKGIAFRVERPPNA